MALAQRAANPFKAIGHGRICGPARSAKSMIHKEELFNLGAPIEARLSQTTAVTSKARKAATTAC